jgi:hypothetical protein
MTIAAIREKLHKYIDSTDDSHVKDLLNYVEHMQESDSNADLEELHMRANQVINDNATIYTVEEAHSFIRASKKQ